VVGQYWSIANNARDGLRGVYHFKTANMIQAYAMRVCKTAGHMVVASDEEVLGWSEELIADTTDATTFKWCDRYFAFDETHKKALLRKFPAAADRIRVTGSARGDLLRSATYERPHEKRYVLFNTSFGLLNSIWGSLEAAVKIYAAGMRWDLSRPEHAAIMKSRIDYETSGLRETKALLTALLVQNKYDIVIRPHPSEKAELWQTLVEGHSGAHVVTASDPYQWTKHAALMIHSDSTLGVEVTSLGTPALNLSTQDEWAKRLVVRDINFTVRSAAEAVDPVYRLLKTGDGPLAAPYLVEVFPPNSAGRTAKEFLELLPPPERLPPMGWVRYKRTDREKEKFTVSAEEFRAAIDRVLPLAGVESAEVVDFDDSVVLLMPA
jgi:surface carbohydrate biosynthesis protein